MSSNIFDALSQLSSDADRKSFMRQTSIIGDELSKKLILKIGGKHSPLPVNQLPIEGYSKTVTLGRLYELEDMGFLTSKMERVGTGYSRTFYATKLAKNLATIYGETE